MHLIETPGIDHVYFTAGRVLNELESFLQTPNRGARRLDGIIYLRSILRNRPFETIDDSIAMFERLTGPNGLESVILATTFWPSLISPSEGTRREREMVAPEGFWGKFHQRGSPMMRWPGSLHSAMSIVECAVPGLYHAVI